MNVRFNSMKTFIPKMLLAGSVMCATLPLAASAKSNNEADTFELQKTELIQHNNSKALTDSSITTELDSLRKIVADLDKAEMKSAAEKEATKKIAEEKLQLAIEEYETQTGNNLYVTKKQKEKSKESGLFLLGMSAGFFAMFCTNSIISKFSK